MGTKEYFEMVGKNVRKYRRLKKISQIKLAQLCELQQSFISDIENGKRNITLSILKKLSDSLDIDFSLLLINQSSESTANKK
ncbi:MAG: helix-turn-helix transcriptional regulator [Anaerorhabdus sp.]